MSDNHNDEIRTAPVDLYERLHGVDDQLGELRRELRKVRTEYGRLHANPTELAVDDLGAPLDPAQATTEILDSLDMADHELDVVCRRLATMRSRVACRLKLTDAAAEDLDRRARRTGIERSR
ncbi:hypothetical protein ACWDYH_15230 [Nocardia goodfellowii]